MVTSASDSSLDVSDIDLLSDAYSDKEVIRTKTFLFVADLARKGPRFHGKKTRLYMWNLIIVIILIVWWIIPFWLPQWFTFSSRLPYFTLCQLYSWLSSIKTYVTQPSYYNYSVMDWKIIIFIIIIIILFYFIILYHIIIYYIKSYHYILYYYIIIIIIIILIAGLGAEWHWRPGFMLL